MESTRGHSRENQCHGTVNVMYRHRHTVHLTTFFFVLEKIFSTSDLTVILFLLEKGKFQKKQKQNKNTCTRTNFLVTVLVVGGGKGILFPVNIFFNSLHCYASLIPFELLISTGTNVLFFPPLWLFVLYVN